MDDAQISLVWFRKDLRIHDNLALRAAAARGRVACVFIWAPHEETPWEPGGASRWWLHESLQALKGELESVGGQFLIRQGDSLPILRALCQETGSTAVFWNRCYEPAVVARDSKIKDALRRDGLMVESFNASLLFEPWTVQNKQGNPFLVFTPFWKHCLQKEAPPKPAPAPKRLRPPSPKPHDEGIQSLYLKPTISWDSTIQATWTPGSAGAKTRLQRFLKRDLLGYHEGRNRIDAVQSSWLSPHFHFGEISLRKVWYDSLAAADRWEGKDHIQAGDEVGKFLSEIGWREFAYHLVYHFPDTTTQPLRPNFTNFPWQEDETVLREWQTGQTGYPIVDAAMRDLWATGWMPNRARMIVASFLTKHLLIPWQRGAEWFWDTLVDADLASNTLGWQWTAGCGADAAPYFRIFNPVMQAEKFDPQRDYIRRWIPELANLSDQWIARPWDAPENAMRAAGIQLGVTYPHPLVDHNLARQRALTAYQEMTGR